MNSRILRVIDANTNRLMEGLRVVEDVARFVLNDKKLSAEIKDLRSKVKTAISGLIKGDDKLLGSRDSRLDVGRDLYTGSEADRSGIGQIVTSNIKRCEEASRVLEEFGKLIDPGIGKQFKDIRYELYEIEKQLCRDVLQCSRTDKLDFDLYVVTDPDVLGKKSPVAAVQEIIKGGAKIIQLRDKKASIGQYYKWAKEISAICKEKHVKFIVNDYIDICLAVDADGIHLGQSDVPVHVARKILGPEKIIGLSTHSREQAIAGAKSGADYISVGPVFSTPSKPDNRTLGPDFVKWTSKNIAVPFVAIGGINETNITDVINAGAKRVAVIRAVVGAKDIAGAVKKLRRNFT